MGATQALLIAAAATVALYVIPGADVVGRPLVWLSTLVHELGHGLTALALGGRFESLTMYADASGAAAHGGPYSALDRAAIAAGGLLGPPLAALCLFLAARRDRSAHVALGAFALFLVVACALWVRNLFGFAFVGSLAVALALLAWKASARVAQIVAAFLAIQLSLATFARSDYLFTRVAETGVGTLPSDTAQIAQALLLPYWFWGGLIALFSLAILGVGMWAFARALR
jgi:hypothetical protein